ncbi:hypothetical protein [Sinisalibacter lacisalsi]|uniref:Lipoprotein n=1 Tax=Sinisalibacter lacisalsi TaxID=1526570 RepID=A0ABQ1QJV3_9RHOB|nr:hypothetical protein [Sinisalibacter lacisalsi]GGD28928.1 hypothetical protein GCM10011358_11290 [Sinisalibacter lacisalsi]
MQRTFVIGIVTTAFLGGCSAVDGAGGTQPGPVPEQVIALAAPYQDISTARFLPEDGCYWYLHAGPVETTLLPLRTADGRPICTASE